MFEGNIIFLMNQWSFVCTQLNGFKYCYLVLIVKFNIHHLSYGFKSSKLVNCSIWHIDGTLIGATIPGQSGLGSNGYEGALHIPQNSRTGASSSYSLVSYTGHSSGGGLTPLQRCSRCILQPCCLFSICTCIKDIQK